MYRARKRFCFLAFLSQAKRRKACLWKTGAIASPLPALGEI
jgi:hypothetical protein